MKALLRFKSKYVFVNFRQELPSKLSGRVLNFLRKPYPFYSSTRQALWLVFVISLFIGVFCYVFQPFGIDNSSINQPGLISIGFGAITLMTSLFNMVLLPKVFPKLLQNDGWTVGKELVWVIWMLLCIAFVNWVYALMFYEAPQMDLVSYLVVAAYTITIGLMPAIGVILYKQSQSLKSQILEVSAKVGQSREGAANFISENKKDKLTIPRSSILLISSAGNYSEIFYERNGRLEKVLLRNRISNLEAALSEFPEIIRCHRKYIINVDKVIHLDGNTQGYKVKLFHMEDPIPVSRSYAKEVNEARMAHAEEV